MAFGLISALGAAVAWQLFAGLQARHEDAALKVLPLTSASGAERNPSFSRDGSQVVYEWQREDGTRHIYIKVVGSGDPIALTSGPEADYGPAWSPDGKMIAFLSQFDESTLDIMLVPPVGGIERKVAEVASPAYWNMQQFHRRLDWTADSRHLVVSAPERKGSPEGLLLLGVDDGEKRWLSTPFSVSPDRIYYLKQLRSRYAGSCSPPVRTLRSLQSERKPFWGWIYPRTANSSSTRSSVW